MDVDLEESGGGKNVDSDQNFSIWVLNIECHPVPLHEWGYVPYLLWFFSQIRMV